MNSALLPPNEDDRLAALHGYRILDTDPDPAIDEITSFAARACDTPIALVSLIDAERQWPKSAFGCERLENPRDVALCSRTILGSEPMVVHDASSDPRFRNNPLVNADPGVIYYAGAPVRNRDGMALGTLCVVDHEPRQPSELQLDTLQTLANQVMHLVELHEARLEAPQTTPFEVICSHCHAVKSNSTGAATSDAPWQKLQSYLDEAIGRRFSHGICPDCLDEHYRFDV